MFGVALSDSLTAGLLQIPVILLIVDEVSSFFFGEAGWGETKSCHTVAAIYLFLSGSLEI